MPASNPVTADPAPAMNPEVIARIRAVFEDVSGIAYNPFSRKAWLTPSVAVNYLACAKKPA